MLILPYQSSNKNNIFESTATYCILLILVFVCLLFRRCWLFMETIWTKTCIIRAFSYYQITKRLVQFDPPSTRCFWNTEFNFPFLYMSNKYDNICFFFIYMSWWTLKTIFLSYEVVKPNCLGLMLPLTCNKYRPCPRHLTSACLVVGAMRIS